MQQINQNQSNINPITKPFPLASEQVNKGRGRKESMKHATNACEIFGLYLKAHRGDVNFTVELEDGSVWIPSTANLRVIAPTYQCIRLSDELYPYPAPIILVSNGKHPSIDSFDNWNYSNPALELIFREITVLMCDQMIAASKMSYRYEGQSYDFIAQEFLKDKTTMDKASFAPVFLRAYNSIMGRIVADGRADEFNALMGGALELQESLF